MTAVTITGVSGYVGSAVCLEFLKDGGFKVRGTVRDKNNPKKIQTLIEEISTLKLSEMPIPKDCL